jgi:hypothetical protein
MNDDFLMFVDVNVYREVPKREALPKPFVLFWLEIPALMFMEIIHRELD